MVSAIVFIFGEESENVSSILSTNGRVGPAAGAGAWRTTLLNICQHVCPIRLSSRSNEQRHCAGVDVEGQPHISIDGPSGSNGMALLGPPIAQGAQIETSVGVALKK